MDALSPSIVQLLGVDFSNVNLAAVAERLLARPPGARFSYVVTPNADHIDRLLRIPRLRPVYQRAMLCLLDSTLISHFAGQFGLARPVVVNGADLTAALLPRMSGLRIAVVGMEEADFAVLARRFPEISFIHHNAPMALLHNTDAFQEAAEFVCAVQAAFTFFALGSPVQELLAYAVAGENRAVGIGLCTGSALSFAAGTAKRAPLWMRRAGLEWMHRLAQNPRRLAGRYLLADPRVLLALAAAAIREKMH